MLEQVKDSRAYGNVEVVRLLKAWLEEAEKGKLCHVTVTACQMPNAMACDFAGTADLAFIVPFALDTLKIQMAERERLASGPPQGNLDASHVCYNIGDSPVSFDFLPWLVYAEMTRRREGAPAPLRVAFTMGQDGQSGLNHEQRRLMFANVLMPLVPMIGAVQDKAAAYGRTSRVFVNKPISDAAREGEEVPKLLPAPGAMAYVKQLLEGSTPITITLRECETWAHRNSNLPAWLRLAGDLRARGERVIFLRDTAKAGEPLVGEETCPIASTNLQVRLALYEQSKLNLFVPNGPWNLALFGSRPWLMFHEPDENDEYHCNQPEHWLKIHGIEVGAQFPWSLATQRIVWKRDSYENLQEALTCL